MFLDIPLAPPWLALLALAWGALVYRAVRAAPWRTLFHNRLGGLYAAATALLVALWSLGAGLPKGMDFHLLGLTVFTLMFGAPLGILGASVAATATAWWTETWQTLPLNALVMAVWPVALSHGIYRLVHALLPPHIMLYIFLCGFFNAALTVTVALATTVAAGLLWGETFPLLRNAWGFLPLYAFAEAFFNGVVITGLVALKPQWLQTFDDAIHLPP
ncbi:MAG: energy-coupling factor ABC transporter permease [Candidatus Competibacterales bacterium]